MHFSNEFPMKNCNNTNCVGKNETLNLTIEYLIAKYDHFGLRQILASWVIALEDKEDSDPPWSCLKFITVSRLFVETNTF